MKLSNHKIVISQEELETITHQGQDHWVVPVIMMVEGVHSGSGGPLLYTADELGSFSEAWNGTSVVVGHPSNKEGSPVSANSPELVSEVVGRIYNTRMEGDKLKAEAWINVSQLESVSSEAYEDIKESRALDVSIGVFSEEINIQGEFNNEEYRAVARNLRPDHLALLPGATGACSWDDGCGVRVNEKLKENEVKNFKTLSGAELVKEGLVIHILNNEVGFREIIQNISQKLDAMDTDLKVYFLDELFDDKVVYRVHNRERNETAYFQRNYSVQEDGSVDFTTDPVEVRKEVSFVEMESGKMKRNKFNSNPKSNSSMDRTKGCPTLVSALIANALSQFTEADKEWLTSLPNEQLEKLAPLAPAAPVANKKEEEKPAVTKTEAAKKEDGPVKINSEELKGAVKALFNESEDPIKFINEFMPEGLKGQMKSGLSMYHAKRKELIEGIVANSKFEAAQLEGWADADLQSLSDSVTPVGTYAVSGESGVPINTNNAVGDEGTSMLNLPKVEK